MAAVTKTQYKISDFITWQKTGLLVLSPKFQRRSVWRPGAKSYLLDTIVRGYPIPIIFLREQKTDLKTLEHKREVVDGQQRIRTLLSFIAPSVLGSEYDQQRDRFQIKAVHNKDLADRDFAQLPPEVQQSILDYEFSVQILPSSIGDREVVQIFARMNSTGYKLNAQELRNARFFGEFKTSMYRLAAEQLPRWENWGIFKWDNIARMDEVELTSEFAQLMLGGIVGKSQPSLDRLYEQKDQRFPERKEVEKRFQNTMDVLDDNLGQVLSASAFKKRAPFYALFAAVYDATYRIDSALTRSKPRRMRRDFAQRVIDASAAINTERAPRSVLEALERRTTHPGSRRTVVNYLTGML